MAVRFLYLFLIASFSPALAAAGGGPGTVVVVGETPESVAFQVPGDSPYKFQYDSARITLWDTVDKQNAFPPGTVFIAGPGVPGCEVDLSDFAALQRCFSGKDGGVAPGCAGFNTDADNDVDLEDYAAFHGTIVGPICSIQTIPTFVEGLTASTGLSDVQITMLIDPDGDSQFTVETIQPVTVVSIDITPTSGALGTETTITLQPAISPIAFDPSSTAEWIGVFNPAIGAPSPPFAILYDVTQVRASGPASAIIVAGDGSQVNPPDFTTLDFPGTFDGLLALELGISLVRDFSFTPTVVPAVWESITYLDSSISTGPPVLNGEPLVLEVMIVSGDPNPVPDEEVLLQSYWAHLAVVMRIVENPTTVSNAPAFVDVDLATFDIAGIEIDRRENVRLDRVAGDDGDPSNLLYQSDLTKPIILLDVALDPADYPNVVVLHASGSGGSARILPL